MDSRPGCNFGRPCSALHRDAHARPAPDPRRAVEHSVSVSCQRALRTPADRPGCGGWPALPASVDLGFVFALNRRHAGQVLPYCVARYRFWSKQWTQSGSYRAAKSHGFAMLEAFINSERAGKGLPRISAPDPFEHWPEHLDRPTYWTSAQNSDHR